jgi:DNA-binding transcriptional MerR regulator
MKHTFEILGKVYESTKTLSEIYGISRVTLFRWAQRGLVSPIRLGGRNYFDRAEVENRLAAGE